MRWFTSFLLVAVLSISAADAATMDGYQILFQRNTVGSGQDLAVVSYPTQADLLANTNFTSSFAQTNVNPDFSTTGLVYDGLYRLLFQRNVVGSGQDLAVVSYPTYADLLANTNFTSTFAQINVNPDFSTVGLLYDGSYRLLFQRNSLGTNQDLAVVSFPTFADLLANTNFTSSFAQISVNPDFSVVGFTYDGLYQLLFQRNTLGTGQDLALVGFGTLADLLAGTNSISNLLSISVNPDFSVTGFNFIAAAHSVPLPPTLPLFLGGLGLLGVLTRRSRVS